jgi:hypothetical protein
MTISLSAIGLSFPFAIDPGGFVGKDCPHEPADRLCLFGRAVLISAVHDREKVETRSADRSQSFDYLLLKPGL